LGNNVMLMLDNTYIDVGPQQIFMLPEFYSTSKYATLDWAYSGYYDMGLGTTKHGTRIFMNSYWEKNLTGSTIANADILPEWWGCKGGYGVSQE